MSTPKSRARHRDNAAKLGKLQLAMNFWLDTTAGQLTLIGIGAALLLLAGLIGH